MARDRSARRERRAARSGGLGQAPWRQPTNPYRPVEVLTPDQVEVIHRASLQILSETGIDFLHPEALAVLGRAGAAIDGERARIAPDIVEKAVASAPSQFTLHARNPAHDLRIGGDAVVFCEVASAPNVSDLQGGRRPGNRRDYQDLLRLGQSFNVIHAFGGYPTEPVDLPPSTRHLDALADMVRLTDKVFHAYALGAGRILDALEIVRIARSISADQLRREPSLFTIVNTSSPLRLDGPMIEGLIEMARMNQVVVITPFTLAGAMAPASLAGALALQNAEALAGITLTQLVSPGAPVMYGGFTSNVDMRSGSPAFGTPEYAKAAMAGGQLARRYGIPYRSSNATTANAVDAQAAYEAEMSVWGAVMGGSNLVMHGAGWMEGGLVASFEKLVVDVEILQMMAEFLTPIRVDEAELGLAAIAEVGPGGHFFGSPHTLERYENAFYSPIISNWQNYETWKLAGGITAEQRAAEVVRQVLSDFEPPPLDDAIGAELTDFVERRRSEGGVDAA
ncbi:MAG TPA: trimethylamine methyltransferase family protein [Acidimicrobiia bacterium]|nr:trimethylamine methyltransferase family protein [Acidimicrobiia bacterium]